ncbi:hypothetical protein VOLCADRAFT_95721 [Volvox carteri f. nagariensis]|uniref:C3HC-type domain-containing protein n=1 Tax=Volvox carteri f. nagariensis TaxID=3068 RepID=D8U875_VOLCA|nr:uncharacterized protein VOLCADRAFT_95721 [Volvox carteri f. nagariensis]EFJ44091.1 hypothetical protein VOLCADRAFT_95721 [Volvox carteri f. nagariensis]|eukprot:XP_002954892.1 hypothetical protein VOLCADRAFT_95721 [Volvox carteri f. nagariensis]
MASVYERITNALSSLGKRRERDNGAENGGRSFYTTGDGHGRAPKRFRPWEQSDLHRRLETYKPLTWFSKPDTVGPVPCALRGWINDAVDSLCCEHCNAKLVYPPNVSYDQRQAAADLFSPSLTTKHNASCPWRQTQCNPSLLAYIPNTTNDELCQVFQTLQGKLLKVDVLPEIDAIAIQALRGAAAPYGSYDDLVMLGIDGGAVGGTGTPTPRKRTVVRITDVTEGSDGGAAAAAGMAAVGSPLFSDGEQFSAGGGAAASPTYILQPSKMTPQQKARLLALMGWDIDVLQPDSASGSGALPYTQSAGYSLQHLGVKPKSASKPAVSAATAATAAASDRERYPMSSVVLKCPHCNCRTGLWNFAGLRPVPTGRLTPSQQAAGVAALLSPRAGGASSGGGAISAVAASGGIGGGADPLSMTIAGGQYGLHGAAARTPGPSSSTAFRFGSSSASEPVFGIVALDAEAQQQKRNGGSSRSGGGFGSPLCGTTPLAASKTSAAVAVTGRKRKAEEQVTPEPMAVDPPRPQTPAAATPGGSGVSCGDGLTEPKRLRLERYGNSSGGGVASPLPAAADTQLRELDPVGQHRSWCPWIYTGTRDAPHVSGWQHMLRVLSSQQQQQQQVQLEQQLVSVAGAAPAQSGVGEAAPSTATSAAAASTSTPTMAMAADARKLKDSALAAIRSL